MKQQPVSRVKVIKGATQNHTTIPFAHIGRWGSVQKRLSREAEAARKWRDAVWGVVSSTDMVHEHNAHVGVGDRSNEAVQAGEE
ncbi:unnamed protein product [Clonostachys rosea]|uniref:Uncharacterized protein n=1 Tax=Bionectria ochroleuca TaxID=29856 RepID=A0ABY6UA88_BIOOC|nr:unnamed protein product [Clonostachys rosea]